MSETTTTTTIVHHHGQQHPPQQQQQQQQHSQLHHHQVQQQQEQQEPLPACCQNHAFLRDSLWPGLGLLGESYLLFSIGTLKPVWQLLFLFHTSQDEQEQYQQQHDDDDDDTAWRLSYLLQSITYTVVIGVITGMLLLGLAANKLGRRKGSILTASFMFLGATGLTIVACWFNASDRSSSSSDSRGVTMMTMMQISFLLFGFGVGGEYPLAAASASEKAMSALQQRQQQEQEQQEEKQQEEKDGLWKDMKKKSVSSNSNHNSNNNNKISKKQQRADHYHRGRQIQLVFTMQGVGIFINCLLLTLLLMVTGRGHLLVVMETMEEEEEEQQEQNNNDDNDDFGLLLLQDSDRMALLMIWRIMYAVGMILLGYVLYSRIRYLPESPVWLADQQEQQKQQQQPPARAQCLGSGAGGAGAGVPTTTRTTTTTAIHPPPPTTTNAGTGGDVVDNAAAAANAAVVVPPSPSGISMVSTVSSLSAPSIAVRNVEDHSYDSSPNTSRFLVKDDSNYDNDVDDVEEYWRHLHQVPSTSFEEGCGIAGAGGGYCPNSMLAGAGAGAAAGADNNNNALQPPLSNSCGGGRGSSGMQTNPYILLWRNYGVRLLGSSFCWMLWDVSFYGNKLFQSTFLLALTGDETTLLEFAIAATLNAAVALLGYLAAASLVDRVGRQSLQQWGFLLTGALFVGCGFLYENLNSAALVAMYLGSSFFGQMGPNATTFLVPAEIFPTEVRTFCHGISAASGKIGALLAAVAFNYVSELDMFLLSGYASFAACALTFWTIPETLGLDLYELDRKWRLTVEGRKAEYQGDANHPRYLSYYERNKLSLQHAQHFNQTHESEHDFHAMD